MQHVKNITYILDKDSAISYNVKPQTNLFDLVEHCDGNISCVQKKWIFFSSWKTNNKCKFNVKTKKLRSSRTERLLLITSEHNKRTASQRQDKIKIQITTDQQKNLRKKTS